MKNRSIAIVVVGLTGLGLIFAWARTGLQVGRAGGAGLVIIEGPQKHLVTPAMLAATGRMTKQTAPAFQAEATDGKSYRLEDVTRDKPLILAFIKDGCPCSEAAEPYFNRLFSVYKNEVNFLGVINVDASRAKEWAMANRVPFPILVDPEARVIHDYKAESSAYVALVAPGGTIDKLWPGYSAQMLNNTSERLARLSGCEPKQIDTKEAPAELTTGCPY